MSIFSSRGFTMVELMVVIVLVSIMAAFSLWGYQALHQSASIKEDVNKIGTMLKSARNWAFTRKQEVTVDINGNTTLRARYDSDGDGTADTNIMPAISLSEGYAINTGSLVINQRGLYSTTGTVYRTASSTTASGKQDCVVVSLARAILGKYQSGNCNP